MVVRSEGVIMEIKSYEALLLGFVLGKRRAL